MATQVSGEMTIPLLEPLITVEDRQAVEKCLQSGWVSTAGGDGEAFEKALADVFQRQFAVVTCSGTAALHLALLSCGIGPEDLVGVPTLTFIATANAVAYCQAQPVFLDVDPANLNLSENHLEETIRKLQREGKKLKALLTVDFLGNAGHLDEIGKICEREKILLIEDASQALGSRYQEKPLGSFGLCSTTSFNGNKIITSAAGGAFMTNSPELAKRVRHLARQAKRLGENYVHDDIGFNYGMPGLNASLGLSQIKRLDQILIEKKRIYERYRQGLCTSKGFRLLEPLANTKSNHWVNTVRITSQNPQTDVENLRKHLLQQGISVHRMYMPLHLQQPYCQKISEIHLPNSEATYQETLLLPSSPQLKESEQDLIIRTLLELAQQ